MVPSNCCVVGSLPTGTSPSLSEVPLNRSASPKPPDASEFCGSPSSVNTATRPSMLVAGTRKPSGSCVTALP
jgi:hypothetical protein